MTLWEQLLQFGVTGLTEGCVYALVALGFTIIYNATGIVNFAQGEFVMIGAMVAVTLASLGLPLIAVIVLSALAAAVVAVLLERFAIRPLAGANVLLLIFVTIAASLLFRGAAQVIWGPNATPLPPFTGEEPIRFWGAAMKPQDLWIIGVAIITVIAVQLFFRRTMTGKAMRAAASNRIAARLAGINISHMSLIAFLISGAISGLAGVVFAPNKFAQYSMGTPLAVKGFCGAILGGMGNSIGAVIGGIILGLAENIAAGLISSQYKDAITLIILLLVLFIRPAGLLGKTEQEGL
ncbi:MAG: branched-chain amino acid ABC transporter permease [Armatimonadota bacterium]